MKNKSISDKNLIEAAKEDIANFKPLYEKYLKAVYRYCYNRLGRNKELAEDITSETFVKAIEKFQTFMYRNISFVAWLYTIAHNLIVDYYRDKGERNVSIEDVPQFDKSKAEDVLVKLSKEEMKEEVIGKAAELSDEMQNIFTLRHTEDLTFSQIAKLVGGTEGSIKMKYYRGIRKIQNMIIRKHEKDK